MRVAVTGASGFIGSHVMAQLQRNGHEIVAFARNADKLAKAVDLHGMSSIDSVVADITDEGGIAELLDGADAIVHTAGVASVVGIEPSVMKAVNSTGAQLVLEAAVAAKLDPIIHTSSVAALFPSPGSVMRATDPLGTIESVYGQTKRAAESVARRLQADGHPVVTVYPGGVYGPLDPGVSDIMDATKVLIEKKAFPLPKGGGQAVIDVRDLALGMANAVVPGIGPKRYMAGGQFVSWDEWISPFERVAGVEVKRLNMPAKALIAIGRTLDGLSRIIPKFETPLGREGAQFMSYMVPTDDTDFLAETGIGEYRDLETSVREFVEWLVEIKFLELP